MHSPCVHIKHVFNLSQGEPAIPGKPATRSALLKKGPDPKIQALHSPSDFAPRGNRKTCASELRRTDFPQPETRGKSGGAERDRTVGLLNAMEQRGGQRCYPLAPFRPVCSVDAPLPPKPISAHIGALPVCLLYKNYTVRTRQQDNIRPNKKFNFVYLCPMSHI